MRNVRTARWVGRVVAVVAVITQVLTIHGSASAAVGDTDVSSWAVKRVPLPARDVQYVPQRDVLLASVVGAHPSLGNELVELDPETGDIGRHVFVGSDPGPIAVTSDGTAAFVGMQSANVIARVDLATFTVTSTFSSGIDPWDGPLYVEDLEAQPGQTEVVVASVYRKNVSPRHGGIFVFDRGVRRSAVTRDHTGGNRIEFGAPSTVYGYNNETTEYGFRTVTIDARGATQTNVTGTAITGFGVDMEVSQGVAYATTGQAIDVATKAAVRRYAASGLVEVTPADGRVAFLAGRSFALFETASGAAVASATVAGLPAGPTVLTASATGYAVAAPDGVYLLGPSVGGPPVSPPPGPLSEIAYMETVTPAAIAAFDGVHDAGRGLLYLSVQAGSPSYPGSLIAVDPVTGAVRHHLPLAGPVGPVALSADGSRLYAGRLDVGQVHTVDPATFSVIQTFSLPVDSFYGTITAEDIEVLPGRPAVVAVSLAASRVSPRHRGVVVYDHGVKLPDGTPEHTGANRIEFGDGSTLYGTNNETSGFVFYAMTVDANGVRRTKETSPVLYGFGTDFDLAASVVYATNAMVVDPAGPTIMGRIGSGGAIEAVPAIDRVFVLSGSTLEEYQLSTRRFVGSRALGSSSARGLVWTGKGLAVLADRLVLTRPMRCGNLEATIRARGSATGTAGNDVIIGSLEPDDIDGSGGDDVICGNGGNDTLYGGEGSDRLLGGDGDDELSGGGGGDDIDGGPGFDTLALAETGTPQRVTIDNRADDGPAGEGDNVRTTIERVVGSEGPDAIHGTAGRQVLEGRGGNDVLKGGGGDDDLSGGDGDDILSGGADADTVEGGVGRDRLLGDGGDDVLHNGPGADDIIGGDGFDTVTLGSDAVRRVVDLDDVADDGVAGENDNVRTTTERIVGSPGPDAISGSTAAEVLSGGGGDDRLHGYGGDDRVDGGDGVDRLLGGSGNDVLAGGAGADDYDGGPGADTVDLGLDEAPRRVDLDGQPDDGVAGEGDNVRSTNETILGGSGSDTLIGDDGNQVLDGRGGDDVVSGRGGDDDVRGGTGDDVLFGGDGNDHLRAGDGDDECQGDAGDDVGYACELFRDTGPPAP